MMDFDKTNGPKRVLSVMALVMINIIAVASLRTLPFSAKLGPSLVFYYVVCTVFYFIPIALITAELATTWPKRGGLYVWVREAFGHRASLLVVWFQWIYNIVWYPSILGLIVGVGYYAFVPEGEPQPVFVLGTVCGLFWLMTLLNTFGMKMSSQISSLCSILGVVIPMAGIMFVGATWLLVHPIPDTHFLPKFEKLNDLVLVGTILFGLVGLEMSAVHAQEVKEPEKNYPKALLYSSLFIPLVLMLGSLSLVFVIPERDLNLVTGVMQAFHSLSIKLNMRYLTPLMAACVIIGSLGSVAAWIVGPTKGLLAAAQDGFLPKGLTQTNKADVPVNILFIQALIVTVLASLYTLLPSIEIAYLVLSEITVVLSMLVYLIMFAAAIRLRSKFPDIERPFKVPGGAIGIWLVCGVGFSVCLFATLISFIPPSDIDIGHSYQTILIIGVLVLSAPSLLILKKTK